MSMIRVLKMIEKDLDAIFNTFYSQMLSNKDFAIFFKDQQHIETLIAKQKQYFMNSLTMTEPQVKMLRATYISKRNGRNRVTS
ncbi:protoglobin domain-containing protein [Desulfosediminicola flagellatus]|uniref:protoglobin domain-containing protein n=1 Tax=Desulfosediminicola flagellatus TaxID=2569541 RepID=UPI0010ABEDBE|nr:protoglobin domain-containing protein [Desulfosediminicola flagellatus]